MKTRLYLDTRSRDTDRPCPLYLCISRFQRSAFLPLGVYLLPSRWDAAKRRPKALPPSAWPERAAFCRLLDAKVSALEMELMRGEFAGELHGLDAIGVRDWLLRGTNPMSSVTLCDYIRRVAAKKGEHNRYTYTSMLAAVQSALGEAVTLPACGKSAIRQLEEWMQERGLAVNTRTLYMGRLAAVFHAAAEEGLISQSPMQGYRFRHEETRKRSLSVESLRRLFALPLTGQDAWARDLFMLSFLLIGCNTSDLFALRPSDYHAGRIHYRRAKTGKLYDVMVTPEADAVIRRLHGQRALLNLADRYANAPSVTSVVNGRLAALGGEWADLTMYWARHSWATIAANDLDVSQDVIAHALGHSVGSRVTGVYVDFSLRKVDEANRRVTEWVMYGRR